jgi:hypothetical protein
MSHESVIRASGRLGVLTSPWNILPLQPTYMYNIKRHRGKMKIHRDLYTLYSVIV